MKKQSKKQIFERELKKRKNDPQWDEFIARSVFRKENTRQEEIPKKTKKETKRIIENKPVVRHIFFPTTNKIYRTALAALIPISFSIGLLFYFNNKKASITESITGIFQPLFQNKTEKTAFSQNNNKKTEQSKDSYLDKEVRYMLLEDMDDDIEETLNNRLAMLK